ncbi:MAG: hypothetical protein DLM62_20980 [Pseudonocardiales bacterium]|nr:MAG: hypothetical protein DLM62_20980 [Pseudonocardiales bacterium]
MADQSVMLVRYRAGVTGETARTVHLVSLRDRCETGMVGTLCGSLMSLELIETVAPGRGMPCSECVIRRLSAMTPAAEQQQVLQNSPDSCESGDAGQVGVATYEAWGWPITQHCDQIRLSLDCEVSAIAVPIPLSIELIHILTARRCVPAVLAHPDFPEHHVVLAGERYGVMLPWPPTVHEVTGVLMLPPTMTPRGPITWIQPPCKDSLRLSREIDVFGALRAALKSFPAAASSPLPT